MIKNFLIFYHTVKHLKPIQVKYQLLYRLKKAGPVSAYRTEIDLNKVEFLNFIHEPPVYPSYHEKNTFAFLNKEYDFGEEIDWQFQDYGALWNYNLQYLNCLLQEEVALNEKIRLLKSLYNSGITLEPYPVSLRSINAIRLICKEQLQDTELLEKLYAELNFLSQRLEFHLLGNHLLENAFALLMGGAFFKVQAWIKTAQNILSEELQEQILSDGGHFELSPMYHQIVFFRVLELIDWYSSWGSKDSQFEIFLRKQASKMWAWLKNISFKNGTIPHFNDSAEGISYPTSWLCEYAENIGLKKISLPLADSGYRSITQNDYECKIDVAQIGPSYQPGHAHADTLSFILYYKGKPLIVEQGTSTYDIGAKRIEERSTKAHNTVVVNDQNQSEVWSGFRVGKRAVTKIIKDTTTLIKAQHDGYKELNTIHTRTFEFSPQHLLITDDLSSNQTGIAYFHFHPNCDVERRGDNAIKVNGNVLITVPPNHHLQLDTYLMANGYYQYLAGKRLSVAFKSKLQTSISF